MWSPLISVIIPFYNVEQYIGQCLESIFNQNLPEEDYEVICVNDASPDNSREIVLEFQKKHSNLILVEHDINKKLGPARNTGRSVATGKYIWNIDSDDYIKPNSLSTILDNCIAEDLDVLIFNFDHCNNNIEKLNVAYPFTDTEVFTGIEFINKYCLGNFHEISPIWTQVYKREFLDVNEIFSPPINMGEDVPFTLKALLVAKRIRSITDSCYAYRLNENSLGGAIEVIPQAIKLYEKCFICTRYISDLLKFIPVNEEKIKNEYQLICKYILSLYPKYINRMTETERKRFRALAKKDIFLNWNLYRMMGLRNRLKYFKFLFFNLN